MKILIFILFAGLIIFQFFLKRDEAEVSPTATLKPRHFKKVESQSIDVSNNLQPQDGPKTEILETEIPSTPDALPPQIDVASGIGPQSQTGEAKLDPGSMVNPADLGSQSVGAPSDQGSQIAPQSKSDKGS